MTVRPAGPADAPPLAAIFNQYVGVATMVLEARTPADFREAMGAPRTAYLVAEGRAGVVGYAAVRPYSPRRGYALAGEVSIFLDGAARGRGWGDALYRELLPRAAALGYRHLTAKIWATNTESIRFHARHGFTRVGTQRGIGLVGGQRVDIVLMERVEA